MSIVVHCILPCDTNDKAKAFYGKLFPNWGFKSLPPNEFWEITNKDGSYPHKVYLAMMKGPGTPAQPTNYYTVPYINEYIDKAVSLGATLVVSKTPVPGKGYYAELRDINNQPFGFWEDKAQ